MWDWSNQSIQRKTPEHGSLTGAYEELSLNRTPPAAAFYHPATDITDYSLEEMKEYIQSLLTKYKLNKMTLLLKNYTSQSWQEMHDIFSTYQRARMVFLKTIAYSEVEQLQKMGITEEETARLKNGITPENFNIHIKIPFDFGGTLDFDNFSFIQTHHTHSNIHRILDMQITKGFLLKHKKIFIPYFEGKFYHD